ncbi:MAG: methyltransferase [Bacteroidetes bacterium]|jgi:16S rRNA (cytosine967-C5)-methyltransferase|nr:methyltransferase [Bacteroidota bacterium]
MLPAVVFNEKLIIPLFSILKEVFNEKKHADKCLHQYFSRHTKLQPQDKAFFSELCYDLIRNWRLLQESFGEDNAFIFKHPFSFLPAYYYFKKMDLPEPLTRITFNKRIFLQRLAENQNIRKFRESYTDELDTYCVNDLGEEKWNSLAAALNGKPLQYIRANTLKISRDRLSELLREQRIKNKAVANTASAIENLSSRPLFALKEFHEGLFEIQDISSQKVSEFTGVKKGERVIDACAGNGGKSLHLAALLENKGKVIALDINAAKLEVLKKRAARAGIQTIETRVIDSDKVIKNLNNTADRLLLDVPCSGSGVFKRNPDAKWNMEPSMILQLIEIQKKILDNYSGMCKKGGTMVYANCSVLPSEGEKQIVDFLQNHTDWKLEDELRIHPDEVNADGFYMARLLRIA